MAQSKGEGGGGAEQDVVSSQAGDRTGLAKWLGRLLPVTTAVFVFFFNQKDGPREVLEWPYTRGGGGCAPPPPMDPPPPGPKAIVGKNEIYRWENLVGPFFGT